MDEQKIKLSFPEVIYTNVSFGDIAITVKPYLDMTDKQEILSAYFESKEKDPIRNHIENEIGLMLAILDRMTNIEIQDIDFIGFMNSGLWYGIKSAIVNFNELKYDIEKISSLDSKINRIATKVESLIDEISKVDLSKEGVSAILEGMAGPLQKLGEIFPQINEKPSVSAKKKKNSSEIAQTTP